ncbi:MAG: hypothetical protein ACI9WM_001155 [Arenicella sp.]|jgi:hypothetical protein|tara:strand:+ start:369 stop:575 length:207 start_codon:yes stop_codon:yes gene_type:complete
MLKSVDYNNREGITAGPVNVKGVIHLPLPFSGEMAVTKNTTTSDIITKNTTIFIGSANDINENGGKTY